ncbi:MAG: DUF3014 domain-containing protein [Burkholderiaceae bacterium]
MTEGSPAEPGENTDAPILAALTGLQPRMVLARFLNLQDFVRRFVVTVDNLPREIVPSQWSAVRRTPGQLGVRANGDRFTLSPENFSRYDPVVGFLESIDPRKAVAAYVAFYPLLQYEYRAMGFPKLHFSDRVVDAIDDMLSAPEVTEPIELVQPKVLYKYADPTLEKLGRSQDHGPDRARERGSAQGLVAPLARGAGAQALTPACATRGGAVGARRQARRGLDRALTDA